MFAPMADFAGIGIPKQARGAFRALAELSDEDAANLRDALEIPGELATGPELIKRARERVPALRPHVTGLVFAVLGLIGAKGQDLGDVEALAKLVGEDESFDELEPAQRARLAARIETLIRSPCLRLTAKAVELRTAYEHVFAEARILTDVRPVFADGEIDRPAAGVVVDTLRLDYYGPDGEQQSFFVALDQEDMESLRDLSTRALAKSKVMRQLLESAGLATWKGEFDAVD